MSIPNSYMIYLDKDDTFNSLGCTLEPRVYDETTLIQELLFYDTHLRHKLELASSDMNVPLTSTAIIDTIIGYT